MIVAPIARYLIELDAGDDATGTPPDRSGTDKPSTASKLTIADEAYARGFERGKATAEAQIESQIAERDALHQKMLAAAREAWTRLEAERLTDRLVQDLE